jgi:Ca-activated chloride channel family protein
MEVFFYRPAYLWFLTLIPLLVVVHRYSLRYVERKALVFANFKALERITGGEVLPKNYLLLAVRVVTLLFFIFTAAGLTLRYSVPANEYDLVLAIDVSSSMSAKDFTPSRLEAVRNDSLDFIQKLQNGTRVGVVAFSSTAVILDEPSLDHAAATKALSDIQVQKIGGTAIGDALIASTNSLVNSKAPKAVLLLTDGQSNVGASMQDGVNYCKENEVRLFAVGVGSAKQADVIIPQLSTGVDEEALSAAALETGGKYYSAPDTAKLGTAFQEIASKTSYRDEENDLSIPLMAIAFLLVFVDWGLSSSRYRIIP